MIDTHCHLTDPRLFEQLDRVLARAAAAGVVRMVTIGTCIEDDQAAVALCAGRENVRCAVGIHPNYVTASSLGEVPLLRGLQAGPAVVALGEMGLDYFHQHAPRQLQAPVFEAQLQLATEFGRPVVIHSRESIDDCLAILRNHPAVPAVFHCFTGTPDEARQIIDAGYLLGFTGAVTYKKNDALREVAAFAPADRILVETDAPYLTPEPVRKQKTNEPALVMHTAAIVAAARNLSLAELDRLTTDNAARFFRWA